MKGGVLVFPGSNCDHDCYHVLKHVFKMDTDFVWHKETSLDRYDLVVVPGGFTYGDYLRTGAMAKLSPVMSALKTFVKRGAPVIGICNGFQILLEAGLLPGAMMANVSLKFICDHVYLRTETQDTPFTSSLQRGSVLKIPVAHYQGNYTASAETLLELEDNDQIVFKYCDAGGNVVESANPNGSVKNIAGICNRERNVVGMMPHPERCSEPELGSVDGRHIFESVIDSLAGKMP
ncbi:MAG: phosphoribosylformylglycinamidine synthase subunit PurQ [Deltaproteobacteria bacterium]|nr:phosphoribosylformylglycinamidine synthase subunit PurQ [Deltaproteobacteria bacterium]NIS76562.1 phosphoribosylformylglycinamidine synthase subunit PurQ [Deltaproteobacteria bacterium]